MRPAPAAQDRTGVGGGGYGARELPVWAVAGGAGAQRGPHAGWGARAWRNWAWRSSSGGGRLTCTLTLRRAGRATPALAAAAWKLTADAIVQFLVTGRANTQTQEEVVGHPTTLSGPWTSSVAEA